ncbi:MAG: DnaJ-domain-containing protein 1, partial [Myxococcota bacterium]
MKRKPLDVAREFCELTGAADLLSYLELDAGASTDEAVVALTARRRRLQGMQGNPKYKAEALFLIRNFASLEDALADPAAHAEAMAESPDTGYARIFEATLRSLLAAGAILPAQREHLERNAADFEIGPAAFREMLSRLSVEAGRPGLPPVPSSRAESSTSGRGLVARDALNHYQVLGAERFATFEDIRRTYHARATEAGQYADPT